MATAAQTLANRANSALSTGPRTEAGKQASRFNAASHGLTSKQVVLPHESQAEWEAYRDSVLANWRPASDEERVLAVTVAETHWRLERLYRTERAFMESRMNAAADADPSLTDGDAALAQLFIDPAESKRLSLLLRYVASAERAHARAVSELRALQTARAKRAQADSRSAVERNWIASLADATPATEPEAQIGFVSHSASGAAQAAAKTGSGTSARSVAS